MNVTSTSCGWLLPAVGCQLDLRLDCSEVYKFQCAAPLKPYFSSPAASLRTLQDAATASTQKAKRRKLSRTQRRGLEEHSRIREQVLEAHQLFKATWQNLPGGYLPSNSGAQADDSFLQWIAQAQQLVALAGRNNQDEHTTYQLCSSETNTRAFFISEWWLLLQHLVVNPSSAAIRVTFMERSFLIPERASFVMVALFILCSPFISTLLSSVNAIGTPLKCRAAHQSMTDC